MSITVTTVPTGRTNDGLAAVVLSGPAIAGSSYELHLPFRRLHRRFGHPQDTSLDLLLVSSVCYVLDKLVPRRGPSGDAWTRTFDVEFPVSNPVKWQSVSDELNDALSFLSGDVWRTSFRAHECALFEEPSRRLLSVTDSIGHFTSVCLFSGGLDSLAGAIELLNGAGNEERILLVGHYDAPGPRSQQRELFAAMKAQYGQRVELLQVRASQKPAKNPEGTLRARSFVFMAIGMYAASAAGPNIPVHAFENGLIALNPPLTPSRAGSCSTRTMHPYYLQKLRAVLAGVGLSNTVINPYELKTKGECLTGCGNTQLLSSLIPASASCSHGSRRQHWVRKGPKNCGYCVPCLFRRAAVHKLGIDDGHQYGVDVCRGELDVDTDRESGDDLRALTSFLRNTTTREQIRRAVLSSAGIAQLEDHVSMVSRGLTEIREWLRAKGSPELKRAAGI